MIRLAGAHFSAYMLLKALHRMEDARSHVIQAFNTSLLYEGERSPQTLRYKALLDAWDEV